MSTHVLDASGARPLSMTVNDPARTHAQVPAKQGDDVTIQLGGSREIRVGLPPGARIQRRQYVSRSQRTENGKAVKDDAGEFVYDESTYEQWYLVLAGSAAIFARSSKTDETEGYEGHPHTQLHVKRQGSDLHFSESGELLDEVVVGEALGWTTD